MGQEVSGISGEVSLEAFLGLVSSLGICEWLLSGTGCGAMALGTFLSKARQVGCPWSSLSLTQVKHSASEISVSPQLTCSSLPGRKVSMQDFAHWW